MKTPTTYPPGLSWKFEVPNLALHQLFEEAVLTHPQRVFLHFLGTEITYVEAQGLINELAAGLQNLGVKKGHRVGLCLPNSPYAVIAYYAILRIGGVVVNMNPLYTPAELSHQLRDSGATIVLTADLSRILNKLTPLVGSTPLQHLIVCPFAAMLPPLKRALFHLVKFTEIAHFPSGPGVLMWDDVARPTTHPREVALTPEKDPALLQYTGGTTGLPKAAVLTHRNLVANTLQVKAWLGDVSPQGERFLALLPLFHVFAMTACLNLAVATASTLVLLPAFNLRQLLSTLVKQRITIFPGVPTLFNAINHAKGVGKKDLSSIRWCISGGAGLPQAVKQSFEALTGATMVEGYGLTEASPVVICNPRHTGGKAGSIGLPLPGTEIEIRNPEAPHTKMKLGERGEIWVKGPQVMAEYWHNPAETKKVFHQGWLRTGDIGYAEADGYITLTDRLKDIIISNGYNIYPRVIEEAAYRHPAIAEVTVIGCPDAHKGEVAKAFIVLKDGAQATEAELMAFFKKELNPIERPAQVEFRASLPKTFTGKLSKKELVAEEQQKRRLLNR